MMGLVALDGFCAIYFFHFMWVGSGVVGLYCNVEGRGIGVGVLERYSDDVATDVVMLEICFQYVGIVL